VLAQQFRSYSPQGLSDEQIADYTIRYLQTKENAGKMFDQVKAIKVIEYLKSVVTLDQQEILFSEFNKL